MKLIKFLLTTLVTLIVLVSIAITLLITTIDPNDKKALIISSFQDATGRDLSLVGDVHFTFFPKVGIQLGQAQISNAQGFGETPFAQIDNVLVSVDLLSLLMFRLNADTIQLHGLRVDLKKNQQGHTNWQDLLASEATSNDTQVDASLSPLGVDIAGVKITDARITYHDQQADNIVTLDQIDVITGHIGNQSMSPMRAELQLQQTNPSMLANIHMSSDMMLDLADMQLGMADLSLKVTAQGEAFAQHDLGLQLKANVDLNLQHETLSAQNLTVDIQQQRVAGHIILKSFSQPHVNFALHSDELDLDKLIFPTSSTTSDSTQEDIQLPVSLLRELRLVGDVTIGKLHISGLLMTDLVSKVSARQGVVKLDPLKLNIYQGQYSGTAQLDVSGSTPRYHVTSELKDLAIANLLEALSDRDESFIRGQSSLSFDIKAAGDKVTELKKQLNGTLAFKATDGALQSENLARNIEYAMALLKGRAPQSSGQEIIFESFTATGVVKRGVFTNDDLKLLTPLLVAAGAGQVDIPSSSIAYTLGVGLSAEGGRQLPIQIEGPLAKPSYSVDIKSAMTGQQKQKLEEKKKEINKKLLDGVGDKLGDDVKKKLKKLKLF